jgi:hypothetical protein
MRPEHENATEPLDTIRHRSLPLQLDSADLVHILHELPMLFNLVGMRSGQL